MKKWFDKLFKDCIEDNLNPVYFCRYEDLIVNTEATTRGVLEFLLDLDDLKGTNAEMRLKEFVAKGNKSTITY